jgi:dimethylhistidine N-methyltransferase
MRSARLGAARVIDAAANFRFHDLHPPADDFAAEVLDGLGRAPKTLPCKYFYDDAGSRLFDRICEVEEYYPTRTEITVLRRHRRDIAALIGPNAHLIEFGSGASTKIRFLLDAIGGGIDYLGVDISKEHLLAATRSLAADFPRVGVTALCADYTREFVVPEGALRIGAKRVGFFPGSTIGNFTPSEARSFLAGVARLLGAGGEFLIGVDLKKDRRRLEAAYNDRDGVTAAFNLNLLVRINRELGADFDVSAFSHRAIYNEGEGRIEMHLASMRDQVVGVAGRSFRLRRGETIHTENSYKFAIDEFQALSRAAGFEPAHVWTDDAHLFSVHYLRVC